jgi:FkbM family methyltransferase
MYIENNLINKNMSKYSIDKWEYYKAEYNSLAQNRQDLFALFANDNKTNGFFVEFGACDGLELTNTYLLENKYQWKGILAEPCKYWHENLYKNRKDCIIDTRAVWVEDNSFVTFTEVELIRTLSNITIANGKDGFYDERNKPNIRYDVPTVTLNTLLKEHNAPKNIDFLSIDTEGSEVQILQSFDFSKYEFNCIVVECWGEEIQAQVQDILLKNNYTCILNMPQDQYFIHNKKFIP